MKKLMIAAAIVCAAAMSHAAQINWAVQASSWAMDDGTLASSKPITTMYLINAADWSTIETAIKGGATTFTTADTGILDAKATANTKGYIAAANSPNTTQLTAGTAYDFAYLVFDTRDPDDIKYFASKTMNQQAFDPADETYKDTKKINFDSAKYSTAGLSGGWQSVPEPTSALLLLLGVAGLALKRKRA